MLCQLDEITLCGPNPHRVEFLVSGARRIANVDAGFVRLFEWSGIQPTSVDSVFVDGGHTMTMSFRYWRSVSAGESRGRIGYTHAEDG